MKRSGIMMLVISASLATSSACVFCGNAPITKPISTAPATAGPSPAEPSSAGPGTVTPTGQSSSGKTAVAVQRTRRGHRGLRRLTAQAEKPAK